MAAPTQTENPVDENGDPLPSTLYPAAMGAAFGNPPGLVPARNLGGRQRTLNDCVVIGTGAEGETLPIAGSKVVLGQFKPETVFSPFSRFEADANITVGLGDASNPVALVEAGDVGQAGGLSFLASVAFGQRGLPLWRLLGYDKIPDKMITLCLTLDTVAAGVIEWYATYTDE